MCRLLAPIHAPLLPDADSQRHCASRRTAAGSSIEDVFGTLKKARPTVPSAKKAVPASSSRTGAARTRTRDASGTSPSNVSLALALPLSHPPSGGLTLALCSQSRTTRARSAQPSTARTRLASALPPTPSIRSGGTAATATASRRPRRGESIITAMYSVNGSPLGSREVQFRDDDEGEDDWDLMSAGEASRVEEQPARAKKGKAAAKVLPPRMGRSAIPTSTSTLTSPVSRSTRSRSSSLSRSVQVPPSSRVPSGKFDFRPPTDAPDFAQMIRQQIDAVGSEEAKQALQALYDRFLRSQASTAQI